jgi:hypothetical protein
MARKKRMIHGKIPMRRRKRGGTPDEAAAAERRILAIVRAHGLAPIDKPRLFSRSVIGSFGVRTFAGRFYQNHEFTCRDCGAKPVWTGRQQKWWFEEAGGEMEAVAIRCRECRVKERERKAEARRLHLEGLERKRLEREKRNQDSA